MASGVESSYRERDAKAVMGFSWRDGYAKTGRLPSCCLPATPK
jgi:hypothetical protein